MLIFLSFCLDDSNLRVESEEADPVPGEGLGKGRSEVVETLEMVEDFPFLSIDKESDVLETEGARTSFPLFDESSWKMEGGVAGLPLLLLFLPFFLFFPFFADASTMEEMITSPNKKNGNKLHWICILRWMDAI